MGCFDEITASSLVLVDQQCNKLRGLPFPSTRPASLSTAAMTRRATTPASFCTPTAALAWPSACKKRVLPLNQQSTLVLSALAFHDCAGIALQAEEKPRLARLAPSRCGSAWRGAARLLVAARLSSEAFQEFIQ